MSCFWISVSNDTFLIFVFAIFSRYMVGFLFTGLSTLSVRMVFFFFLIYWRFVSSCVRECFRFRFCETFGFDSGRFLKLWSSCTVSNAVSTLAIISLVMTDFERISTLLIVRISPSLRVCNLNNAPGL